MLTKIPQQHRHCIVPFTQIWAQIDSIKVGILRRRATLQLPFEDHHLTIDPQPILRIRCNSSNRLSGTTLERKCLTEGDPLIRTRCRRIFAQGLLRIRIQAETGVLWNGPFFQFAVQRILNLQLLDMPISRIATGQCIVSGERRLL